jgi:hypothetical protein
MPPYRDVTVGELLARLAIALPSRPALTRLIFFIGSGPCDTPAGFLPYEAVRSAAVSVPESALDAPPSVSTT